MGEDIADTEQRVRTAIVEGRSLNYCFFLGCIFSLFKAGKKYKFAARGCKGYTKIALMALLFSVMIKIIVNKIDYNCKPFVQS